jgi:MoaA/NifB/PqqE/SkfB family radical SAM enzyme
MRPLPRADIKVGFACNNRCIFCAQGEKRSESTAIPFDELIARLESVKGETSGLVLTGGEPTLHKDILRIVASAARMGYRPIQIQTNGRLLSYPKAIDALLRAGATEFSPSVHGSTAEIHDALTRAPGSFAQTTAGMRNVAKLGVPVVTNSVITKSNVHDLPNIVSLLGSLGVRVAQLAFVHPVGTAEAHFDEVVPRLSDVVEPLRRAKELAQTFEMRLVCEGIPYCFLRGMEELAVEDQIPHTTVIDLDGERANYSEWRVVEGKSHGEPCTQCAVRATCEGPWREYPAAFGWGEFVPLDTVPPSLERT